MSQLLPLVRAALLGTQREPIPHLMNGSMLADLMVSLHHLDPEASILSLAGAARLAEFAGQIPDHAQHTSMALPPLIDRPPCNTNARNRLIAMLDGQFTWLLPEFLTSLAQLQLRVPDEILPPLLDHGIKMVSLRPLIVQSIGNIGRWLASQNPAWSYASADIDIWDSLVKMWHTANAEQRTSLLTQLRTSHPDWGLALVQTTWKIESVTLRSRFIRLLEAGLSTADEPFLETALDDRDLTIRRAAADLLARVPTSRLVQRMQTYAMEMLQWTPYQRYPISVRFPNETTPSMIRDGLISGDTPRQRGVQLTTIVGAVPLTHWQEVWKASPTKIAQAALTSGWPRTLIRGFTSAALRQQNPQWAAALLNADSYSAETIRLAVVLTQTDLDQIIVNTEEDTLNGSIILKLLHQWNGTWSALMAQQWVLLLVQHVREAEDLKPPGAMVRVVNKRFAQLSPTNLADEAASTLLPVIERGSAWSTMVHEAALVLKFRQKMLADLQA